MAIVQVQNPPKTGPQAVERALRDLRRRPDPRGFLGGTAVKLSRPLPVYRLGLADIRTRKSLDSAKLAGWRYLIEPAEGSGVAYADVREKGGGDSIFASFSQNRNAERLTEAAHLAQQIASGLSSNCEARILDVPALYVSAIWLTSREPTFIPYIDAEQLADPAMKVQVDPDFVERLLERAHIARQHLQGSPDIKGTPIINKFFARESSDRNGEELAPNDLIIGTYDSTAKTFNDHTIGIVSAILIWTVIIQVILVKSWT